jgi:hypothetical protein
VQPEVLELSQSLSLWELQYFLYMRSGTYKKGITCQECVLNVSELLLGKNRGRNSPAVNRIAMEIQGCLEVMLQSKVAKFAVT